MQARSLSASRKLIRYFRTPGPRVGSVLARSTVASGGTRIPAAATRPVRRPKRNMPRSHAEENVSRIGRSSAAVSNFPDKRYRCSAHLDSASGTSSSSSAFTAGSSMRKLRAKRGEPVATRKGSPTPARARGQTSCVRRSSSHTSAVHASPHLSRREHCFFPPAHRRVSRRTPARSVLGWRGGVSRLDSVFRFLVQNSTLN